MVFGFVIGALRGSIPVLPPKAALVLAPEGDIVEQLSGDPIERAVQEAQGQGRAETLLWDLVDTVRAAAKDERIPVMVLDLKNFGSAGQPTLEELARAIREFRAAGKKVITYGVNFDQSSYYLASQADEIYVDPIGAVFIDGYDRYPMFYKEVLDKLGVEINVFRAGIYKSAVEPFTRTDMSPQDREETLAYLGSLWSSYQKATMTARRLEPGSIAKYVDTFTRTVAANGGNTAEVALQAGLVTGIKTRPEVEKELIDLVGEDDSDGGFNSVSTRDYIRIVHAEQRIKAGKKPRIGVIVASGDILDGEQPSGTIGGDSTSRLIREARYDDDIRAVVLRVDSPGGSVLASEQIYREIDALRAAGKPVIVSMGDYAASGGYYIAAGADEIWASPATITGSIGVFAVIPTFDRTLDKIGVKVDGVGTTPLAGQARLDRALGADMRSFFQSVIERTYEEFLARVAAGRDKSRDQVDSIAQGRVWAGADAQRLGLVDRLGSFDDAVKSAARHAKLEDYEVHFLEPELSWAQELALQVDSKLAALAFRATASANPLQQVRKALSPVERELQRLGRFTERNHVYAYCFCTVE